MDFFKRIIPIDLFSKKRLLFNIIIFSIHSVIFSVSFMASLFLFSRISVISNVRTLIINTIPIVITVKFMIFSFFNFKRISHFSLSYYDTLKTAVLVFLSFCTLVAFSQSLPALNDISPLVFLIDAVFTFAILMIYHYLFLYLNRKKHFLDGDNSLIKTLIVGAGTTAEIFTESLRRNNYPKMQVVGFVDDDENKIGMRINGIRIWGPISDIEDIIKKTHTQKVLIAIPKASRNLIQKIIQTTTDLKIEYSIIPSTDDIVMGNIKLENIRDIEIEDLLKRDKLLIDVGSVATVIKNKVVVVTGAAGSIGSEICKQIMNYQPQFLIALDQSETELFYLARNAIFEDNSFIPIIADITNKERIRYIFNKHKPDVIFHAAAYKHVPMMERNIQESIINNVLGTKILADEAVNNNSNLFVFISTDKAVNPTSIMGLSKRIAEKYIQNLNSGNETAFITIRFGNVLDSSGNVINIFKEQIKNGGPVTITHKDMKRYFMLTEEAVQLVLQAASFGNGGEIYILDMGEPVKIEDLAKTMIKLSGLELHKDIQLEYSGIRPGEKLFEDLTYINDESICKTPHDKIFAYTSNGNNQKAILKRIEDLLVNIYSNGDMFKIAQSIVPEFRSEKSTNLD